MGMWGLGDPGGRYSPVRLGGTHFGVPRRGKGQSTRSFHSLGTIP